MKKICTLFGLIAVAAVIAVSCETPTLVASEVTGTSLSKTPKITTNDDGTVFEYQSTVNVNRTFTRADGEDISVTLRNEFRNHTLEATTTHLHDEAPYVGVSYSDSDEWIEAERIGDFNVYEHNYELDLDDQYGGGYDGLPIIMSQTAEYDDGIATQEMPCYPIEGVRMDGEPVYTNVGVSKDAVDGCYYAGKMATYNLLVACNDEEYPVTVNDVKRILVSEGEPYVNGSETVRKWLTVEPTEIGDDFVSHIEMHQTMSTGDTRTKIYDISLPYPQLLPVHPDPRDLPIVVHDLNFTLESMVSVPDEKWPYVDFPEQDFDADPNQRPMGYYVTVVQKMDRLIIKYANKFDVAFDVSSGQAFYDDGFTSEETVSTTLENISVREWVEGPITLPGYEDRYEFCYEVNATCHGFPVSGFFMIPIQLVED